MPGGRSPFEFSNICCCCSGMQSTLSQHGSLLGGRVLWWNKLICPLPNEQLFASISHVVLCVVLAWPGQWCLQYRCAALESVSSAALCVL